MTVSEVLRWCPDTWLQPLEPIARGFQPDGEPYSLRALLEMCTSARGEHPASLPAACVQDAINILDQLAQAQSSYAAENSALKMEDVRQGAQCIEIVSEVASPIARG